MLLFFYYEAKIIIEMREKLMTRYVAFAFCATFKRGFNRPKIDSQLFLLNLFINERNKNKPKKGSKQKKCFARLSRYNYPTLTKN